eukprot:TRINITY_DN103175_c0_g1_i1.p1 TRINITY_DN103175_c0_g1~~TRINITY_DN103175_c0_g1_i1.p1  ORF type:complete len:501 (+),score=136.62 TRINITY_DN103175_c0_g1_i1:77-1579(+)
MADVALVIGEDMKECLVDRSEVPTPSTPSTNGDSSSDDATTSTTKDTEAATPSSSSAQPSTPTSKADKAAQQQKLRDNAVLLQLTKTKMCAFFERGRCASKDCRYAHSLSEIRPPPNLHKTKICRAFMQGNCSAENCAFAHGDCDLRVTQGIYKTQMCNFYERGYCKKGARCNHAHGSGDMRPPRKTGDPLTPSVALKAVSPAAAAAAPPATPLTPGAVTVGKENVPPPPAAVAMQRPRTKMMLADLITGSEAMGMPVAAAVPSPSPSKSVVELASMAFSPMPSSPLWGYGGSLFPPTPTTHNPYEHMLHVPHDPIEVLLGPQQPPAMPPALLPMGAPLPTPPPPPPFPPQLPAAALPAFSAVVPELVGAAPGLELQPPPLCDAARTAWSFDSPHLGMPLGWMPMVLDHSASTPKSQDAVSTPMMTPLPRRESCLDPVAVNLSDKLASLEATCRGFSADVATMCAADGLTSLLTTPEKTLLPKVAEGVLGNEEKKRTHKL